MGFNLRMGRKPQFDTSIRLLLTKAKLEQIETAAREAGENRLELIRGAIDKELVSRGVSISEPEQAS